VTTQRIRFGRYELIEQLATGGMAELYRAVLTGPSGFSKTVAIKKILPEFCRDEGFRDMFQHEGRIMAALNHRNLVQVFELGEVEGELYISLELVTGCDLAEVIERNRKAENFTSPALAALIGREVCRGLEYVHGLTDDDGRPLHIVHRDVNPQNILLSEHGDVKLGDFGIARSGVMAEVSRKGRIRGKLEYLSPEQARGDQVGPASDVYAVGLILFELLTSSRFIQGVRTTDLMDSAAKPTWRPIRTYNPSVSAEFESMVQRALRAEPEGRYPSANSFARVLERIVQSAPRVPATGDVARLVAKTRRFHQTHPGGRPEPAVGTPPVPATDEPKKASQPRTVALSESEKRRTGFRRTRIGLILALPAAVVLAVVVWLFTRPDEKTEAPVASSVVHPLPEVIEETPKPEVKETPPEIPEEPTPTPPPPPKKVVKKKPRPLVKKLAKKKIPEEKPPPPVAIPEKKPVSKKDLAALGDELKRQRARLARRGIRARDFPSVDSLVAKAGRQIKNEKPEQAGQTLLALDQAVDRLVIDRAFIERKMQRLQRLLEKKKKKDEFKDTTRKILNHVLNGRYPDANRIINRAFDQLEH
jgi:hypothetical protein